MTAGVKPAEDQFTDLVNQYHQQRDIRPASFAGDIDAEEVAQEVRMVLLDVATDITGIHSIRSWLFKVVVNKSINGKREVEKPRLDSVTSAGE